MDHQHSRPGPSPEAEPGPELDRVGNLQPPRPGVQLQENLPLSPSPIPRTQCVSPENMSHLRRHHIRRRQHSAQPIESLVQRLRTHSLRSRDIHIDHRHGPTDIPTVWRQGQSPGRLRPPEQVLMDIDHHEDVVGEAMVSSQTVAQTEPPCNTLPTDIAGLLSTQCHAQLPSIKPPTSSILAAQPSSIVISESIEAGPYVPYLEIGSKPKLECDDLDIDEGYEDGSDDFAWINDGRSLIQSLANHARQSGALQYRTSAEAAKDCSQIVHKMPRMRRRRQKKNQTRLRASSTASTCGLDGQDVMICQRPD